MENLSSVETGLAGRVPPHSFEAEVAVLGALLLEPEALSVALEFLQPEHFYKPAHRHVFLAAQTLFEHNQNVDIVTVTEQLRRMEKLEAVGGTVALSALLGSVATAANIENHARIVYEKYMARRLISTAKDIVEEGYSDRVAGPDLLDRAQARIFEIDAGRTREGFVHIKDVVLQNFKEIEQLRSDPDSADVIRTGFEDLDAILTGLYRKDLIIIAARPSMGKTSFVLSIVQNVTIDPPHHPVAFFSLEMSKEQLVMRMLCSEARVDSNRLRKGYIKDYEFQNLMKAAGLLTSAPIYIDDTPGMTVVQMRAKARRLMLEKGLRLIVVDYLQLMQSHDRQENRVQEISAISRQLKALAKELDVPVVALSQLSRAVESRGGSKRPMLSDLRESGAIEQDADLVVFLYREEMYDRDCPDDVKGIAEVIVGKHRNGPTGDIKVKFFPEFTRFENLSRAEM
jgi:replicative DNA helicase